MYAAQRSLGACAAEVLCRLLTGSAAVRGGILSLVSLWAPGRVSGLRSPFASTSCLLHDASYRTRNRPSTETPHSDAVVVQN